VELPRGLFWVKILTLEINISLNLFFDYGTGTVSDVSIASGPKNTWTGLRKVFIKSGKSDMVKVLSICWP
jgi:hypothetical protein